MEISKEVLNRVLNNHDGKPFMFDQGGGPITPKKAFIFALDLVTQGATKDSSLKTAALVDRIAASGSSLNLEAEDVSLLKANMPLVFRPTLFRQLHDIVEPPASPIDPEDVPPTE